MTLRHLAASAATFLVLMMVPLLGKAGESAAVAPAVPTASVASETQAPTPSAPEIKNTEELFVGDLFTPAPTPKCEAGACWGNGTPCGKGGVCYQPQGSGCGICQFN